MKSESLKGLLTLFNIDKKSDAEAHCRDLVIRSEDFVEVILAASNGLLDPYDYATHFNEIAKDLYPSEEELHALAANGIGQLKDKAKKAVNKIEKIFNDRRLLSVHLFYTASREFWHMFYFDQRDQAAYENHWEHGPHLHYLQNSFTRDSLADVWDRVNQPKPKFPKSLHIRYDNHHNRQRRGTQQTGDGGASAG